MRKAVVDTRSGEETAGLVGLFLKHAGVWAVVLAGLGVLIGVGRAPGFSLRPGQLEYVFMASLGLFLPFSAFAGGVAVYGRTGPGWTRVPVVVGGVLVAVASFVAGAQVAPRLEVRRAVLNGSDVEVVAPFGPDTPAGYGRWLEHVRSQPRGRISLSVEEPSRHPPARVAFLLNQLYVIPALALILALLGHVTAQLTASVRPSRRRHLRWLLGLLTFPLFVIPYDALDAMTVARPYGPGAPLAWAGLIVPGVVLAACWGIAEAVEGHRSRVERRPGAGAPHG